MGLLEAACDQRRLQFVPVHQTTFDPVDLPKVNRGDLVYRVGVGQKPQDIERTLLKPGVITLHQDFRHAFTWMANVHWLEQNSIPVPQTVHFVPKDHELLLKAAESLGGFPIIVKALGGSHGVGVMKIDSASALKSIVDFLHAQDTYIILRRFIPVSSSARLIVLGNKVIDSIEYRAPKNDFRSNVGETPNVHPKKFSAKTERIAIDAVRATGTEFGGVDILIDRKGNNYVAEVNFPCNFSRCQNLTGVDIAGKMVDYMLRKAKK